MVIIVFVWFFGSPMLGIGRLFFQRYGGSSTLVSVGFLSMSAPPFLLRGQFFSRLYYVHGIINFVVGAARLLGGFFKAIEK